MRSHKKRIISLLPGTTEIVCSLGMEARLVGRSHECDFPDPVQQLPACTEPKFKPDGTSYQIDQRVKALLQEGLSIYRVDAEKLAELRPDIIITQDHCKVCAASLSEVQEAVREVLGPGVKIISVSPVDLAGVFDSIAVIAEALQAGPEGEKLIQHMKNRFQAIKTKTASLSGKNILCLEWLDPLMTAGNWMPELIQIAGGNALEAEAGKHSPWIEWQKVLAHDPEIITILPCGYSIPQTLQEIDHLITLPGWKNLKAVRQQEVYIPDGNQYFNRPGPRLTDSAEILAEIMHPDIFNYGYEGKGWIRLQKEHVNK